MMLLHFDMQMLPICFGVELFCHFQSIQLDGSRNEQRSDRLTSYKENGGIMDISMACELL